MSDYNRYAEARLAQIRREVHLAKLQRQGHRRDIDLRLGRRPSLWDWIKAIHSLYFKSD